MEPTTTALPLVERSTECGCGCGCGCSSSTTDALASATRTTKETTMTTQTYSVTGLTCGHCVQAVTSELTALEGVSEVHVDLNADGASAVTVTSAAALAEADVASAVGEAGDYHLAR